jgi:cyanophycinase
MSHTAGPLVLIGGAEDKVGGRVILSRFVQLAGGQQARIAIIATASSLQDLVGRRYATLFRALGTAHVDIVRVLDRSQSQEDLPAAQVAASSGIFLTGGDQLKLTAVLGGTRVADVIRQRHAAGVVVGGTSAGASAAAEHMLAYGASGLSPRRSMMQFGPGLGLLHDVVVDQHFGARGRVGRLMTAVAHNPELLGIGLDEDTAVEVQPPGALTVIGRGSVTIVDGAGMSHTDIHSIPDHAPLTIFNMRVHVLTSGYRYDLETRTPHLPNAARWYPEEGLIGGEGI